MRGNAGCVRANVLTGAAFEGRSLAVDNEHNPGELSDPLAHTETLGVACAIHCSNLCDAMKYLCQLLHRGRQVDALSALRAVKVHLLHRSIWC